MFWVLQTRPVCFFDAPMTVSTEGLQLRTGSRWVSQLVELLSSMRFAISLLTVICIASVIGTVVKQHEPANNYVNQFGPFWADVFGAANLYSVYSAWWFLLILAFLVISTSLCITRNTPKIFSDFKAFKENIREQSLKSFPNRAENTLSEGARSCGQPHRAAIAGLWLEGQTAIARDAVRPGLDGGRQKGRGQQDWLPGSPQRHRSGVYRRSAGR